MKVGQDLKHLRNVLIFVAVERALTLLNSWLEDREIMDKTTARVLQLVLILLLLYLTTPRAT